MAIIQVTDSNFDQEVLQSDKLVVVDFWAEWCAPCRLIAPILEEIDKELSGQIVIAKLNVDENPVTAAKHQIMGIPTMKFFKDGKTVNVTVGLQPKNQLLSMIRPHLQNA